MPDSLLKTPALPGFKLAVFATCFACLVVVLGAFTRLVDAGLGCPDWPGCYGHILWPTASADIAVANEAFPDTPVDLDKTWPEVIHRYLAGTLGLLILALAILGIKERGKDEYYPFRQPIFMLVLVIWQALFGMWTVTLKLWPQVVSLHLMGGFTTLVLISMLAQRLSGYRWQAAPNKWSEIQTLRPWVILALVVVAVQVSLGGWVASNYAAFGCPPKEFPTCHGSYWPEMDLRAGFNFLQDVGPNYLGGLLDNEARTAIHQVHRVGALITTIVLLMVAWRCLMVKFRPLKRLVWAMLAVLAVQIILGVSNVVLVLPLWIAVSHNLVGALLVAVIAAILTQIWRCHEGVAYEQKRA